MNVDVSRAAADFIGQHGGQLWVWAAHPRLCCWGSPAFLHAATAPPPGISGFAQVPSANLHIWFRAPSGRHPGVLEIALRQGRRPRLEAYWDSCAYVL